ncbi:uncharacterized protein LOC123880269 [Maniola jurtina]|uniref:uncharacterized protein LOC123880269 n=1 Tax=Maniola jurtina TaxID=191418 RepID=UPI001E68E73C|nr:uncharacterized protein LOC123880269 [Maniola jurtina]
MEQSYTFFSILKKTLTGFGLGSMQLVEIYWHWKIFKPFLSIGMSSTFSISVLHCNRLCAYAVPTLNLPGFHVTRRTPLQEVTNINVEKGQAEKAEEINMCKPSSSSSVKCGSSESNEITFLKQKIKKIERSKDNYLKKWKKALKITENPSFLKATRNFTSAAMILLMMQLTQTNKDKFGRRYSKEEKIFSLAFYKMDPRAYRWLRNMIVLPAPVTLSRMISRANLKPGVNVSIFSHLKKRGSKMSETDKLCVILFDEMALCPHFDYNKKKDLIRGFVDSGKKAENKIADHVLVFMLRGVVKNYKQPLAYTFCKGSTSKAELKNQLKAVISEVQSAGFTVIATICDQGASNVSAIKELVHETKITDLKDNKEESKHKVFRVNNQEIIPLFDIPHMLKGIRNNMLKTNIICKINDKEAIGKWDHIVTLYKENPAYKGLKFLPKLTDHHVIPEKK